MNNDKAHLIFALLVSSVVGLLAGTLAMELLGLPTFIRDLRK